jgi:epsin
VCVNWNISLAVHVCFCVEYVCSYESRGTYDVCFSPRVAVREKAKQLVALLKDDRKLKEERAKAHTARERQQALGSDSPVLRASPSPGRKRVTFGSPDAASSPPPLQNGKRVQPVEQARPSNLSEEEMQLKLALQLSKQQADEEATLRRQEEESLTAALALSVAGTGEEGEEKEDSPPSSTDLLLDLDTSVKDPWGASPSSEPLPSYDSVVMPATTADPWLLGGAPMVAMGTDLDPWGGGGSTTSSSAATTSLPPPVPIVDPWSVTSPSSISFNPPPPQHNPFDLSDLGLPLPTTSSGAHQLLPKIEAQFLGTNANLVDLDLLTVAPPKPQPVPSGPSPSNPFGLSSSPSGPSSSLTGLKPVGNPFEAKATTPSLNQLASTNTNSIGFEALDPLQAPLVPVGTTPLVATGNPLYPPLTAQSTAANQTFNPFS